MKKFKKFLFCGIIIAFLLILSVFMLNKSSEKTTYIEYFKVGENCEAVLSMHDKTYTIEQEFKMPYELFCGVSLRIGTYARENNSRYEMIVTDKTTNTQIYATEFNTTGANDNNHFKIFTDSPIKVDKTHIYSILIRAKSIVNQENAVGFYIDDFENIADNEKVLYNNMPCNSKLCMNVYGGDSNEFWFIFTLICEAYIFVLVSYILYLKVKEKPILKNGFVQASLLAILVFLMLSAFVNVENFCDEVDNINGGLLINKGKILYVDYYTGHTPFAYLLCSVFAMFHAESVEQFRLIYYALIALIYMGLYLRHKDNFGKVKMFMLPIIQIAFGILLADASIMVLSDNIQAICMIALTLEFLQYLKDEKLDLKRSIIVSLSIFCSFASAFVSAYAIFAIAIGVLIKEIGYWKNNKFGFVNLIKRYWKLVICSIIPFAALFGYLVATRSLVEFYQQAYKFNTEVYSQYLADGLGSNIFQPFFIGITNFIQVIPKAILKLAEEKDIILSLAQIVLVAHLIVIIARMFMNKQYIKPAFLLAFICFGYTRTNELFHEIAAWSIIIAIVILFAEFKNKVDKIISAVLIVFVFGNYMYNCEDYLFREKKTISDVEYQIIQETSENEEIFFDMFSLPSVYPIYKGRLPMNRLTFVLPWYMDWYELDVIDDFTRKKPNVVIYDEHLKAWNISGFDPYMRKYLYDHYKQSEYSHMIWILK